MTPPLALLAGGLGTRLGAATAHAPKSLIEVAGQPFLGHQLALLQRAGLEEVVICTGHYGEQIERYAGDGARWGLRVRYSRDGARPRGTAGALRQALPQLGEAFLVMYGDSYLETDYLGVAARLAASPQALGVMTILRNRGRWDRSNVVAADERILHYDKRNATPGMEYIDYGLGALRAEALQGSVAADESDLADVYMRLVREKRLLGYEVGRRFFEVGSPEGWAETDAYLKERKQHG